MRKKIKLFIVPAFLALISLNLNCSAASSLDERGGTKAAPDFALRNIRGEEVALSQFKGKNNVLLVFGATWCLYCVDEIPELKEIYERYKDREVKLIYIDIQESQQKVSSFAKKHSIPYTVLLDIDGDVARAYGVSGIPHQVIIDKKGLIYYKGPKPRSGLMPLILRLTQKQEKQGGDKFR